MLNLPVLAYDGGGGRSEATKQIDGRLLWKAIKGGDALAKTGEWEFEPMPSNRDEAFLARCRFDTPQAALDALRGGAPQDRP